MMLINRILLLFTLLGAIHGNPLSRHLTIINDSGDTLEVDWVHPITGKMHPYWTGDAGQNFVVDSFVNHTFLIRPISSKNDTTSSSSQCSSADSQECKSFQTFTVSEDQSDQIIIHVNNDLELDLKLVKERKLVAGDKANIIATDIVFNCKLDADVSLFKGKPLDAVYDELTECLAMRTATILEEKNEELAFESNLRISMASTTENYTCSDFDRETSTPVRESTWTHKGVTRNVGILHDRPASQIHILHDFISEEECQAVEKAARSTLHRGTVADGKGGSRLSENRKAWQAGLKVDWDTEGDLIAALDRRVFDYANAVMGYNMDVIGQEDIMSIQYFGNGTNDPTPDRYMPHCDGDCDGTQHKLGGRVSTMVMYCDVPELGGGTNFQQANVFVKPTKGAAAFFAYMDPVTQLHENGFTTHSGCPVLEGTKRIAVQWMRVGVDAENPWDSFDTNTVSTKKKKDFYEE